MRVAVIGCGIMGKTHAANFAIMPGIELVGVCDIRPEAAERLAKQSGTTPYYSFDDLLSEAKPDTISICLPTFLHKEYVLKAAERGLHIICEKPAASTLAEAKEMIEACRTNQVRLFIAHVVRFFPNYADIAGKTLSGAIGKVGVVHTKRVGGHPGNAKAWYKDKAKSGGVILDLMIHDIDFVCSVLGEVETVYALNRKTDDLDYALVTLRFQSGAIANLEGLWGYPGPFTTAVEIAGTSGVIRFDSSAADSLKIKKTVVNENGSAANVAVPKSPSFHDPYYYELEHFINCIRSGETSIVTAEDAYKAMEIAFAAMDSAQAGRPVKPGNRTAAGTEVQNG